MITNIILQSKDRMLFGHQIRQMTKTGMLNLSDLEFIASKRNALKGYSIKHVPELMSRKENIERIFYIIKKQGVINVDMSTFIELVKNNGIITTLKNIGIWKTTGARSTKTTWANPYVWLLVALELSPEIYGEAVTWLTDSLIINRIEAGNFYKSLSKSISKFNNPNYIEIAKALNYIIWNKHETGIRNTGSEIELHELKEIEKKMSFAIDMGYVKSQEQLLNDLRILWKNKYKYNQ